MKCRRRLFALVLALVLSFSLVTGASAAAVQTISATLSPNITVRYNGEVQSMADVTGSPVYPVLYNGTTYLPIRAVSNMLGIAVDWDQATKTVLLADGNGATVKATNTAAKPANQTIKVRLSPDITVKYNGEVQTMADVTGTTVYPVLYNGTTYLPIRAVSNMLGIAVDWDQATKTVLLGNSSAGTATGEDVTLFTSVGTITINTGDKNGAYKTLSAAGISEAEASALLANVDFILSDNLNGFKTSTDAKTLGTNHIGYDYVEIDWSTANNGYVKVKLTKQLTKQTACSVKWNDGTGINTITWYLTSNEWVKIPLTGGSAEYGISVYPNYTDEEFADESLRRPQLQVRFTAEVKDPDALWLLSNIKVDFENAPNTCAKALELTKNCKTEAEKITAIFKYVSTTIKYDYSLYNTEKARIAAGESLLNVEGERDFSLDNILERKTGVCEHYAVLMAGMLRSLGIQCKVAVGDVRHDDGTTAGHAWVLVKPATGTLNMSALGAGTDGDWIRLDPTKSSSKAFTSNNSNYTTDYCY